jgi:hypothetical protein
MMSDEPRHQSEDEIFQLFEDVRAGLKTFAADLVDRVDAEVDYIERNQPREDPTWASISLSVFTHLVNLLTGLVEGIGGGRRRRHSGEVSTEKVAEASHKAEDRDGNPSNEDLH